MRNDTFCTVVEKTAYPVRVAWSERLFQSSVAANVLDTISGSLKERAREQESPFIDDITDNGPVGAHPELAEERDVEVVRPGHDTPGGEFGLQRANLQAW